MTGLLGYSLGNMPNETMDSLLYLVAIALVHETSKNPMVNNQFQFAISGVKPSNMIMREYNDRKQSISFIETSYKKPHLSDSFKNQFLSPSDSPPQINFTKYS